MTLSHDALSLKERASARLSTVMEVLDSFSSVPLDRRGKVPSRAVFAALSQEEERPSSFPDISGEISGREYHAALRILLCAPAGGGGPAPEEASPAQRLEDASQTAASLLEEEFPGSSLSLGAVQYASRLNLLQREMILRATLLSRREGGEKKIQPVPPPERIQIANGIWLEAEKASFSRSRLLQPISTVCSSVLAGDGGNAPLEAVLEGRILSGAALLPALDQLLLSGEELSLCCAGWRLPILKLKSYQLSRSGAAWLCRLELLGTSGKEAALVQSPA